MHDCDSRVYMHVCAYVHASMSERECYCVCARGPAILCDRALQLNNTLLNYKKLKLSYGVGE